MNELEIKCLKSLVGVTQMDRHKNEVVNRRMEIELTSRVDHRMW